MPCHCNRMVVLTHTPDLLCQTHQFIHNSQRTQAQIHMVSSHLGSSQGTQSPAWEHSHQTKENESTSSQSPTREHPPQALPTIHHHHTHQHYQKSFLHLDSLSQPYPQWSVLHLSPLPYHLLLPNSSGCSLPCHQSVKPTNPNLSGCNTLASLSPSPI